LSESLFDNLFIIVCNLLIFDISGFSPELASKIFSTFTELVSQFWAFRGDIVDLPGVVLKIIKLCLLPVRLITVAADSSICMLLAIDSVDVFVFVGTDRPTTLRVGFFKEKRVTWSPGSISIKKWK
jgi:hypothetical protein